MKYFIFLFIIIATPGCKNIQSSPKEISMNEGEAIKFSLLEFIKTRGSDHSFTRIIKVDGRLFLCSVGRASIPKNGDITAALKAARLESLSMVAKFLHGGDVSSVDQTEKTYEKTITNTRTLGSAISKTSSRVSIRVSGHVHAIEVYHSFKNGSAVSAHAVKIVGVK